MKTALYKVWLIMLIGAVSCIKLHAQRVYANVQQNGVTTGLCVAQVNNPTFAITPSLIDSTYLSAIGACSAWQNLQFTGTSKPTPTTPIYIKYYASSIGVITGVTIQATNGGNNPVGNPVSNGSILFSSGTPAIDTLPAQSIIYDGIELKVSAGLSIVTANLYYAFFIVAPTTNNVSTCAGTSATIPINNFQSGYTYKLYDGSSVVSTSTTNSITTPVLPIGATTVTTKVYSLVAFDGSFQSGKINDTVTINPTPSVSNQATASCSGSPFTVTPTGVPSGTTYTWAAAPAITGGITGGSAQTTPQSSISQTLTNSGTTSGTAIYTVIPKSGSCAGASFTVTDTVKPVPSVANQTAAICQSGTFTVTPTGVPSGTTYTWTAPTITGSITGGSAQATPQSNISQTLTNTGTTAGTATYTVTPKSGSCTGTPFTVTVTIDVNPLVANQTAATCGGSPFTVTPTGVPPGTTYTWAAAPAVTGSITGGSAQTTPQSNISQTLTNTGTTAGTATYTVTPKSGSCTGASFTVTVTVNPKPNGTITAAPVCQGLPTKLTFTATAGTGPFSLIINGTTYSSIQSGTPFNTNPIVTTTTQYSLTNITDVNTCHNP